MVMVVVFHWMMMMLLISSGDRNSICSLDYGLVGVSNGLRIGFFFAATTRSSLTVEYHVRKNKAKQKTRMFAESRGIQVRSRNVLTLSSVQ